MTTNFYQKLVEIDAVEKIEAVVFNNELVEYHRALGAEDLIFEEIPKLPEDKIDVLLSLEEARPYLDYEANDVQEWCVHRFVAWTATRVISTTSTFPTIFSLPRNPGVLPLPFGGLVNVY